MQSNSIIQSVAETVGVKVASGDVAEALILLEACPNKEYCRKLQDPALWRGLRKRLTQPGQTGWLNFMHPRKYRGLSYIHFCVTYFSTGEKVDGKRQRHHVLGMGILPRNFKEDYFWVRFE